VLVLACSTITFLNMPIDNYDWALLGYHTSLLILGAIAIRLFAIALGHLPGRRYRRRLAREQCGTTAAVSTIVEGFALPSASTSASGEGISVDFVRDCEDHRRLALGRSIRAAGWLRILGRGLGFLVCAGVICAALQGLDNLSIERHPAPWAYHWAINKALSQIVWGLPFLAVVNLLEASCTIVQADYRYQLDRVCMRGTGTGERSR
jgi:hypothetical protein